MAYDFFDGKNPTALEMLSYIDENFFKRVDTKRKLMAFTRTFLDKFCEERNLSPVTLTSVEYAFGHYATYMRYSGQLKLNNLLVKSFEKFKETNNFYYVQEYFDTILHELRHHEQFVSALNNVHPIIKNTMQILRRCKGEDIFDSHTYYYNPIELDARHFAFQTLKENEVLSPYYKHEGYVEHEIYAEVEVPFNIVELLKDKELRGMKLINKPVKELEAQVKEIALSNNLTFVDIKKRPEIDTLQTMLDDLTISSKVNAEIAPGFYNEEFTETSNPVEVEKHIDEEKKKYSDIISTLATKDKIRRAKRRAEKKVRLAEKQAASENSKTKINENAKTEDFNLSEIDF